MMIRRLLLAAFAVLAATSAAHAQPATYTFVEGTITLTFPSGWRRLDILLKQRLPTAVEPDTEFEADHGDAIRGTPGVVCTMKMAKMSLKPGITAKAANASFRANVANLPPLKQGHSRKVTTYSPGVEIETRLFGEGRNDMVIWQAMYARGQTIYRPNMRCSATNVKAGLKPYADLVTALTAAMQYKVN